MQYIRDALVTVSKQVSGFADYFREAAYTSYFNINNYLFGGVVPTTQTATDEPVYSTIPNGSLIWRDVPATAIEYSAISSLRGHIHTTIKGGNAHRWYSKATDIELLRFLRSQDGSVERTWQQLQAHVTWRSTSYGADSSFTRNSFINSPLHHEVFWLGLNTEGIPTLVVRTQVHDTIYYNHDPAVYER